MAKNTHPKTPIEKGLDILNHFRLMLQHSRIARKKLAKARKTPAK